MQAEKQHREPDTDSVDQRGTPVAVEQLPTELNGGQLGREGTTDDRRPPQREPTSHPGNTVALKRLRVAPGGRVRRGRLGTKGVATSYLHGVGGDARWPAGACCCRIRRRERGDTHRQHWSSARACGERPSPLPRCCSCPVHGRPLPLTDPAHRVPHRPDRRGLSTGHVRLPCRRLRAGPTTAP